MRARFGIVSVLIGIPVALAIGGGCGGSSSDNNNNGGQDAAADIAVADQSAPKDSAPDVHDAAACTVDGGLETLDAGNAPLGDSGATTATCLACGKAACGAEITACDADCSCVTALTGFFSCISSNGSPQTCGAGVIGNMNAQSLGLCIFTSCSAQCGVPAMPKPDGGSGDAASDAPSDAPSEGG